MTQFRSLFGRQVGVLEYGLNVYILPTLNHLIKLIKIYVLFALPPLLLYTSTADTVLVYLVVAFYTEEYDC